ncbi:NAD-dependent epimerase/dehydratase family protein [Segetibacter sp. 3557_3]|uniref:NAD(P)H-binding protein n=1 Tax=Segetibacter sp. 3557_3 TaxID=2547429 RepID=UPI001058BAC3|nr:NAD(P)H-binding protein [Segetibacter sp. 3557_3]TDH29099.1 NAD-dependent epimerase/dehydratase family protein [Segetibacter sp. 3557_3]
MVGQTAVVLGATGLTGGHVLKLLLQDETFTMVRVLVRKPIQIEHPRLQVVICNLEDKAELQQKLGAGDSLFCCIGTTLKQVKGDLEAYRRIDYDIPVGAATAAAGRGYKNFLLVSSVGANAKSRNHYLRLKGSVEEAVKTLPFQAVHIFQPSMLLGERNEFRLGEKVGKVLMNVFGFMMMGPLRKFRAIEAATVAQKMVAVAKSSVSGVKVYRYDEISG